MGLFREVGRRVERFKRELDESKRRQVTHRCTACGKELYTGHDRCPECGEDAVERVGGDDGSEAGGPPEETPGDNGGDRASEPGTGGPEPSGRDERP